MYTFTTRSKRAEKQFYAVLESRSGAREQLEQLRSDPRNSLGAHKLRGKLSGKWSAKLGSDVRLVYEIDDEKREIVVVAAGSHKKSYR